MADTKEKRVQVSVLLDASTYKAVRQAALDAGLPGTRWIEALIHKALSKGRKQAA